MKKEIVVNWEPKKELFPYLKFIYITIRISGEASTTRAMGIKDMNELGEIEKNPQMAIFYLKKNRWENHWNRLMKMVLNGYRIIVTPEWDPLKYGTLFK